MTEDKPLDVVGVTGNLGKHDFKEYPCLIDAWLKNPHNMNKPYGIACPCPKCSMRC